MVEQVYELFALKYAELARQARQNFIFQDIHDGPMPLAYYVWVARSATRTVVIDTGFSAECGARRERRILRDTGAALALIGVDVGAVGEVVLTHMHYDHAGNFAAFPRATFHLQDREMAYATGRYMAHGRLRAPFDVEEVTGLVRQVYKGKVAFHDGDAELAPGLTLHLVGGHSHGLQIVRVRTRRGWVVVASDAVHFYANLRTGNPYPIVLNVGELFEGYRLCRRLADSEHHLVPGHDPLVLERYPPPRPELAGIVACLHEPPVS